MRFNWSEDATTGEVRCEMSDMSVVLLGDFNPAWFSLHDILPKTTVENANLQVAHPELRVFHRKASNSCNS